MEFPSTNFALTKSFFSQVFGWEFTDYGSNYVAFSGAGLDGGFYVADRPSLAESGATLVVFYSDSLGDTLDRITAAGGTIIKDPFDFPGGRRFHFTEPSGSEFAVWTAA